MVDSVLFFSLYRMLAASTCKLSHCCMQVSPCTFMTYDCVCPVNFVPLVTLIQNAFKPHLLHHPTVSGRTHVRAHTVGEYVLLNALMVPLACLQQLVKMASGVRSKANAAQLLLQVCRRNKGALVLKMPLGTASHAAEKSSVTQRV